MIRRIGALAAVVIAASALVSPPAMAQDSETSDAPATTVRIQARKVESGKVEFGLQLDGQRQWLPRARLFPYPTANVGRWLFASPYTMSDGTTVRIAARLLDNGRIEFGLELNGDRTWLPRARFFPYDTADVGTWLFSSPFSVGGDAGVSVGADADVPAGAPRNLRVAAVICDVVRGVHSVRLEWDPPADGGDRTNYEVTRLRAPHRTADLIIADPGSDAVVTGTVHIDSDVRRNEFYQWSIRPRNATSADAEVSAQFIFRPSWARKDDPWGSRQRNDCDETVSAPPGVSEPGAPQNLRAWHDRDGDRIVVAWSPPAGNGGDRITSYQVSRTGADASEPAGRWISPVTREPPGAAFGLDGATAGAFRYWMRAINSGGIGPWTSIEFRLSAPAPAPAGAPRNPRVEAVLCDIVGGLHSIRLAWDPPAGAGGAASYEVTRLRARHRSAYVLIADPGSDAVVTGTAHVDFDVRRNELYQWSVRPRNATSADEEVSVQFIFRPDWVNEDNPWGSRQQNDCDETVSPLPGVSEPGAPQNLRARHDRSGDRILVAWSPPADDGGDRITSYQLSRTRADASEPAGRWIWPVTRRPQSTAFGLDGATAGAFRYWVRAINSAGVGPWTSVEFIL